MRFLPFLRWFGVAALITALAACGGAKKEAYVEKPVDDLYNKAMDEMVEERYPTAQDVRGSRKSAPLFRMGHEKPANVGLCSIRSRKLR